MGTYSNNNSLLYYGETTGLAFINPANSEVQDFLAETYTYLLETYDIDGFQLDYIRYKDRNSDEDFGYDTTSINLFRQAYPQYASYNITYNPGSRYWNSWVQFRQDQVTKFVKRMRDIIDEVSPGTILSADVGASIDSSATNLYQKSTYWMQQGWLDIIHPMAYGEDYAPYVEPFFNYAGADCMVVPGLGIFMDEFGAEEMLKQTIEMVDIGCQGVVYFEATAYISKGCDAYLADTLYTHHALAPGFNNANTVVAEAERYKQHIDIAYEKGKLDWQTHNDLTWVANQVIDMAKSGTAKAAAEYTGYLIQDTKSYVSAGDLQDRLLLDATNADMAARRDNGDVYTEYNLINDKIPDEAAGVAQLTIDKVNGSHIGEDSLLITDASKYGRSEYNTKWTYVMLLKPVDGLNNVYEVVETRSNSGSSYAFKTAITSGMVVASFHSDGGAGNDRKNLAKSVAVGTRWVLYGIDVQTGEFTSLVPMLYAFTVNAEDAEEGDVNLDGTVDMFDCLRIKTIYFGKATPDEAEALRSDIDGNGTIDVFDYLELKGRVLAA